VVVAVSNSDFNAEGAGGADHARGGGTVEAAGGREGGGYVMIADVINEMATMQA
jgi:hypothetical protein